MWVKEKEKLEYLLRDNHINKSEYATAKLELMNKIKNLDPEEKNQHIPSNFDGEKILNFVDKHTKS